MPLGEQAPLWPEENLPPIDAAGAQPKAVPKRRRAVFDKSHGRCHYCCTPLTLDGKWHVEHMLPRALDGSDELVMRAVIAQHALCAMHDLMTALSNQKALADEKDNTEQCNAFNALWNVLAPRIDALNSAALRTFDDTDDLQPLADIVYGEWVMNEETRHV